MSDEKKLTKQALSARLVRLLKAKFCKTQLLQMWRNWTLTQHTKTELLQKPFHVYKYYHWESVFNYQLAQTFYYKGTQ